MPALATTSGFPNDTTLRGIHMIEGAGHWVQQEAPDQVNEILIDFLGGLDEPVLDA